MTATSTTPSTTKTSHARLFAGGGVGGSGGPPTGWGTW